MNTPRYLITLVGPTAIGKSVLAVALAQRLGAEIISADARQFYREMAIGTAVPSEVERQGVVHHFIQHKSISDSYSVGNFEKDALEKLGDLFKKYTVVIMVGGSGLYVNAVLYGLDTFPEVNPAIRTQLTDRLQKEGIDSLQEQLRQADPVYYKQVDLHNPHRLVRALEVCVASGKPYSSFLQQKNKPRNFTPIVIGITAPRETLYQRIEERVDAMMQKGLLEEAQNLYPYRHLNALQTVGYRELFHYIENAYSLETAVSEIKKNTRRYAKRQLTWFRRQEGITWFSHTDSAEKILDEIKKNLL